MSTANAFNTFPDQQALRYDVDQPNLLDFVYSSEITFCQSFSHPVSQSISLLVKCQRRYWDLLQSNEGVRRTNAEWLRLARDNRPIRSSSSSSPRILFKPIIHRFIPCLVSSPPSCSSRGDVKFPSNSRFKTDCQSIGYFAPYQPAMATIPVRFRY